MSDISYSQSLIRTLHLRNLFQWYRDWQKSGLNGMPLRSLSQIAFACCVLMGAMHLCPYWFSCEDSSSYLSIARSLAENGEPLRFGSPKLHFGPLYPIVISPVFFVSARPFLLLSIFHIGLSVLLGIAIWYWAKSIIPDAAPWLVVLVSANYSLWLYFQSTLSESLFTTSLMWTAVGLNSWLARVSMPRISVGRTAFVSCSILCLAMIRQAGILMAPGYGLLLLLQAYHGQISWFRAVVLTLVLGVPATLAVVTYEAYMTKDRNITQLENQTWSQSIEEGLQLRIAETGRLVLPGMAKAYGKQGDWLNVNMIIYLCVFAGLVWGWFKLVYRFKDGLLMTVPFYYLLHICWPFDQGTRYLLPMLPVLFLSLWMAMDCLRTRRKQFFLMLFAAHALVTVGIGIRDRLLHGNYHREWPAVETLAADIDPSQPLATSTKIPLAIRLMVDFTIDRTSITLPLDKDCPAEINQLLTTKNQAVPEEFRVKQIASDWVLLNRR